MTLIKKCVSRFDGHVALFCSVCEVEEYQGGSWDVYAFVHV